MVCSIHEKTKKISVHAKTSVRQKLPVHWEEKLASFKLFVDKKMKALRRNILGIWTKCRLALIWLEIIPLIIKVQKKLKSHQQVTKNLISLLSYVRTTCYF